MRIFEYYPVCVGNSTEIFYVPEKASENPKYA